MPLPSFYKPEKSERAWNVIHAAGYGALIGLGAALFKTLGPFAAGNAKTLAGSLIEIVLAAVAFALLCAAAAALRNFLSRRLVWHERR